MLAHKSRRNARYAVTHSRVCHPEAAFCAKEGTHLNRNSHL
jgi:hypothetical protein